MSESILTGDWAENSLWRQVQVQYGPPAYLRRAHQVQAELDRIFDHCRRQRDEWLEIVRMRLATLYALSASWANLEQAMLPPCEEAKLKRLHEQLRPSLRSPLEAASSGREIRRAVRELAASMHRFNGRWADFIGGLDLGQLNRLRENYNRYYLLEKECSTRSSQIASQGFEKLTHV